MKRVYGNYIVGEWGLASDSTFRMVPRLLKEREAEFEWLPREQPEDFEEGYLYPYKNGEPLMYDEAA